MKRKVLYSTGLVLALGLFTAGFVFDIVGPRPNIFSLVHDLRHMPTFVDHGTVVPAFMPAVINFIAPDSVKTVADVLAVLHIPLTTRQARMVRLCTRLDELSSRDAIIIQPDPYQYGVASWYGEAFHGQLAASGEIYDMYAMTAAHKTLPLGSLVRVVSQRMRNNVVVKINDRGPYVGGRIIDLSYRAKEALGMQDLSAVYLERLDPIALDSCK